MPKKVVLVGHCGPDSSYLRIAVQRALKDAVIVAADQDKDLQSQLDSGVDLVLINRQLDYGFAADSGVELIRQLHQTYPQVKLMLVSNYAEAQAEAVSAGALPGFGKRDLTTPHAAEALQFAFNDA